MNKYCNCLHISLSRLMLYNIDDRESFSTDLIFNRSRHMTRTGDVTILLHYMSSQIESKFLSRVTVLQPKSIELTL